MSLTRAALCAILLVSAAAPACAAIGLSDKERIRAQAEHDCYDDVQKLCSDVIPDEDKIKACMTKRHSELSPVCAKDFDAGMGK